MVRLVPVRVAALSPPGKQINVDAYEPRVMLVVTAATGAAHYRFRMVSMAKR
jgi:hypothetical protein